MSNQDPLIHGSPTRQARVSGEVRERRTWRSPLGVAAMALALLLPAGPRDLGAQEGDGPETRPTAFASDDDRVYEGSNGELRVEIARAEGIEVDVDGSLDEPAWERASILRGFTQFEPSEGIPAAEETEVLVLVGEDAILFGVRATDSAMDQIRATLGERDGFTRSDDYVRFVIDTFDDQRKAYVFSVNPYGVQHDGLWVEGGGGGRRGGGFGPPIDSNPDFLWESDARMHDGGWTAEVKIPFKSLRFPDRQVQDWGFNVTRSIQRRGFQQSWAPLTSDVANRLTQSGHLVGLRDLDPGL
ncbi:MAG: carbohydrate binding family 9 domain-containing protein, partial [Gemmatimonadota bacterium]